MGGGLFLSMRKILLIGSEGQIGWELMRALAPLGTLYAYDRKKLNLTDREALSALMDGLAPDVVVNAAAYTGVDAAEGDREGAWEVNAAAPAHLGTLAATTGSLLVHYSTDYVFDGEASRPYVEEDKPTPLNVYGATKLAGEEALRQACPTHFILRTSWVYASRGKNFLLTMLKLAKTKPELAVVADQLGAPTWARMVATATAYMVYSALQSSSPQTLYGTYHLTCGGETSWHAFAEAIFSKIPLPPFVKPITTQDYPTPAKRPRYSVLDNGKLKRNFGLQLGDWRSALDLCLQEIKGLQ